MSITAIQTAPARRVERPSTISGYCRIVRDAAAAGQKIVDYGLAHHGLGHRPPPDHIRIVAPAEDFEHWETDLSARVPGGMAVGELQNRLAAAGQFFPLDADPDITVAEAIAHNVSGPLRLTHGTSRDLLLGLRYINAQGELITVGGRTVKNVAGYDVTRLMVGSYNTLGLIADANLRTAALPPQVTHVRISGVVPRSLDPLMTTWLSGDAAPWSLELIVRRGPGAADLLTAGGSASTELLIAYAGSAAACDAQYEALLRFLPTSVWEGGEPARHDSDAPSAALQTGDHHAWRRLAAAHVQILVPPARTGLIVESLADLNPAYVDTLPSHGVIHIGHDWSADQAAAADEQILQRIRPHGGLRIWHRRPDNTESIAPFAPAQPDWPMLGKIKQAMDPQELFNPGRFPYT